MAATCLQDKILIMGLACTDPQKLLKRKNHSSGFSFQVYISRLKQLDFVCPLGFYIVVLYLYSLIPPPTHRRQNLSSYLEELSVSHWRPDSLSQFWDFLQNIYNFFKKNNTLFKNNYYIIVQ